jgi:hypothetical protein
MENEKINLVEPTDSEHYNIRRFYGVRKEKFKDIKLVKSDFMLDRENAWACIAVKFKTDSLNDVLPLVCQFIGDFEYSGQVDGYHLFWFD